MKADIPVCPFCDAEHTSAVLSESETIQVTCEACGRRYEWIPGEGCFPVEADLVVQISQGLLGRRVVMGPQTRLDRSRARKRSMRYVAGLLCCIVFIIVLPLITSVLILLFG